MGQRLCPVIVGRDPELGFLRDAFDSALAGQGRTVLLLGEAGIGKSRLCRQMAQWAGDRSVRVAAGRAVPSSTSTPFRPLTDALMQVLRDGRDEQVLHEPTLVRWLPLLEPVLPLHAPPGPPTADVPPNLRGEALVQLLRRLASEGLVVMLEDLHWADPDTASVLEYVTDNLDGNRLMIVMTLRDAPETAALAMARRLRGRPDVAYIRLDRLSPGHLAQMVRACDPGAPDDLIQRVQDASDGVPLLVEELLVSPGLPDGFAATVRARLDELSPEHRLVIEAAAILGRHFDWELLAPMTGRKDDEVSSALGRGIDLLLLAAEDTSLRFRHALTREAVLGTLIPPRQRELAAAALEALPGGGRDSQQRDLVIDLAIRAGERGRAGALLLESGREALRWGALATASETLKRAAHQTEGDPEQAEAELDLIEALALAGRVDECAAAGGRLITRLGPGEATRGLRVESHLRLAQAAVAASRWQMARHHLQEARHAAAGELPMPVAARANVLEADVMMASDDYDGARTLAEAVIGSSSADPASRCHAFEIVGRTRRSSDLPTARQAFENALVTAETADLALWRLRALHELGTIDLFDHAGVHRLLQARELAEAMGALSTAAVLDLQLSAAFTGRWQLESIDRHANSAAIIAEQLGLDQIRAKAYALLAGAASMRAQVDETDRYMSLSLSAAPEDKMLMGFGLGSRGVAIFLSGDVDRAIEPYARGMAILGQLPHAEPASLRALWPLILAGRGDRRAREALDEARRLNVAAFSLNKGLIGYAEAVLAAKSGDHLRAKRLFESASGEFTNCEPWADLARWVAAPAAVRDGWAETGWLSGAAQRFEERGLPAVAESCRGMERQGSRNPWVAMGISTREADVLRLVARGLANREIAADLHVSPRTVEKHVESLLRKTGSRSRTELASQVMAGKPLSSPDGIT